MESVVIFIAIILIYFLPTLIASKRKHPQTNAIFGLNLFLGWTFLGWVGALVWCATAINPTLR
jgi:hypothetical protein